MIGNIGDRKTYICKCKNNLNKRWISEYFDSFEERPGNKTNHQAIIKSLGAVLLLKEDTKTRHNYMLLGSSVKSKAKKSLEVWKLSWELDILSRDQLK